VSAEALPDLAHWPSKVHRGRTTIIPSTADAIALGYNYINQSREKLAEMLKQGVDKVSFTVAYRDSGKTKKKTVTLGHHSKKQEEAFAKYDRAAKAITLGDPDSKHAITELAMKLMAMALEIRPSISSSYCGFERCEESEEVVIDLLREGDDNPFLRRKRSEQEPRSGKGDGAYRIIINTDVSWWGKPEMNCGVMGALVLVLQQFAPVEIWIQQGWIGSDPDDGVSMFKLDFNGSFDPTQLSFWTGSPYKDTPFSFYISRSIGREGTETSTKPELPCDLFLRGDWMTLGGIEEYSFKQKSQPEQLELAAKWIAKTCNNILFSEEAENQQ